MKRVFNSKIVMIEIMFLIISIFLNSNIINGNITIGHDYLFHTSNLISSMNNFSVFKPNVFFYGMNCGFGYGSGIFYPPLSYKITSLIGLILKLVNINPMYGISVFEILITFLSATTMFVFIKRIFNKNDISFLGAVSYISTPYFLSDIYIRTSLAELLTFVFVPIVCLSIYELANNENKKFYILFVFGYTGMILSHFIITIYLTIFIVIILTINYKKFFKLEKIKILSFASIITLLIVSPYLLNIIEHKLVSNYVFFNENLMYNLQYFKFNIIDLFIKNNTPGHLDSVLVHANYITLFLVIITLITRRKTLKDHSNLFINCLILLIIILILMQLNNLWDFVPEIFKLIQFPFRFCIFLSIIISLLVGNFLNLFDKYRKTITIVLSLLIIIVSFLSIKNIPSQKPNDKKLSMDYLFDYLPIKSMINKDYYLNRNNNIIVKKGKAVISNYINNKQNIYGNIKLITDKVTLELPRFYYLGYSIKLIDENNKSESIKYTENKNGFINITIKKSGLLIVEYKRTLLNLIATIISIVVIIVNILYFCKILKR